MKCIIIISLLLVLSGLLQSEVVYNDSLKQSAISGNDEAQFNLGLCYHDGLGVTKSYCEAYSWFLQSAKQGNHKAEYYLAMCYENGKGTDIDRPTSINWYTKSAESNYAPAQSALGNKYFYGLGVKSNMEEAYYWFLIANANGMKDNKQCYNLAIAKLDDTQKENIQNRANQWLELHK